MIYDILAGSHGGTPELQLYLEPLLIKYRVHAYICGHDHISEHLRYCMCMDWNHVFMWVIFVWNSINGIHYWVVGAGSMTDKVLQSASPAAVHWSQGGISAFATLTVSRTDLTVIYFNTSGTYTNNVYIIYLCIYIIIECYLSIICIYVIFEW